MAKFLLQSWRAQGLRLEGLGLGGWARTELRMCEVSATLDVPAGPAARMRSMRVP